MAVKEITFPVSHEMVRSLEIGDRVSMSGCIVTARDQVHTYLSSGGESPIDLHGLGIYHCGPVAMKINEDWQIVAAGPTTSMREEPFEADIIRKYHPGAIIGKGGMGNKTREAMISEGCVYLHLTGGAAQYLAQRIIQVQDVHLLEFGQVEAMWILKIREVPAFVTMDSQGRSLHDNVKKESLKRLHNLLTLNYKTNFV